MGLDMYLRGTKSFWESYPDTSDDRKEDGFKVTTVEISLGYWRKHPDLHGFIVEQFAKGKDECQEIPLNPEAIRTIIEAVKERKLPKTRGFFFGESDGSERDDDIKVFTKALEWLEASGIAPVTLGEPVALGSSGLAMMPIKPAEDVSKFAGDKPAGQDITRRVYYQASW